MNKIKPLVFLLFILPSLKIWSAPPIDIQADQLIAHQKEGIATYSGNVIVKQGDFYLYGDRLEVYIKNQKLKKIIAYGTPASFKKLDEETKKWTHGRAHIITYEPHPTKVIQLQKQAKITKATGESLASEYIQYEVDSEVLNASGSKQQRVHVILPTQEEE